MADAIKLTTGYGEPIPPAPRHSVTIHMPGWDLAKRFGQDPMAIMKTFKNGYPRMVPHRDIVQLSNLVLKHIDVQGKACFLFTSLQTAQECVAYSISPLRADGADKSPVAPEQIGIRAFKTKDTFFAVIFPVQKTGVVFAFFNAPGSALSSRCAEAHLENIGLFEEVSLPTREAERPAFSGSVHTVLRERIADLAGPSSLHANGSTRAEDVYLFSSGMASIYKPHTFSLTARQGTTVLFGMAFMNTSQIFKEYGPGMRWFGLGTDSDIDDLAVYLDEEYRQNRKVQAIWTEFPANPLLVTPNINRLRALSDKYDITLAIDDTLGSFANVHVLHVADLLSTSLTKTFSGNADVLAGSVVLNRFSKKYTELKTLIDASYVPELYVADAEVLERNSRDYLSRTEIHNRNAATLVKYLSDKAADANSAVKQVYYPTTNASGRYFREHMRSATAEFAPGYGCLLSVELDDMDTAGAFYDSLEVHKGPHLGAPLTLSIPYCLCIYGKTLDWAAGYGLRPTQIRISTGLEDEEQLLATLRNAVEAADRAKSRRSSVQ